MEVMRAGRGGAVLAVFGLVGGAELEVFIIWPGLQGDHAPSMQMAGRDCKESEVIGRPGRFCYTRALVSRKGPATCLREKT